MNMGLPGEITLGTSNNNETILAINLNCNYLRCLIFLIAYQCGQFSQAITITVSLGRTSHCFLPEAIVQESFRGVSRKTNPTHSGRRTLTITSSTSSRSGDEPDTVGGLVRGDTAREDTMFQVRRVGTGCLRWSVQGEIMGFPTKLPSLQRVRSFSSFPPTPIRYLSGLPLAFSPQRWYSI